MHWTPYLVGMAALLAATGYAWGTAIRVFRGAEALLAVLVHTSVLLYGSALLPGVAGWLTAPAMAGTLVVLAAGSIVAGRWIRSRIPAGTLPSGPEAESILRLDAGLVTAGTLGIIGLFPALLFLGKLPLGLNEAALTLEWDTVSGHLPGLVEFLQDRTLWSSTGPFSSYCYALELMAALPIACSSSSWPLLGTHLLALLSFYTALLVLAGQLVGAVRTWLPGPSLPTWIVFTLGAGLFTWLLAFEIGRVGKNDIFQTACLLAALASVIGAGQAIRAEVSLLSIRLRFVLAGVALGLALGTKPSALAYVPLMLGLTLLAPFRPGLPKSTWIRSGLLAGTTVAAIALLVGGFFYLKNLLQLGRLVPEELARVAFGKTLWATLTTAGTGVHFGSVATAVALATVPISIGLVWRGRDRCEVRWPLAALAAFQVMAAITFAITPLVVERADVWFIRLGMPLFALSGLVAALVATRALSALATTQAAWAWPGAVALGLLTLAVAVPLHFERLGPVGLPGYEQIPGLAPTPVYRAVQKFEAPARIYSAGLRPWGLYGPGFKHRVFYDLHSDTQFYDHLNPTRLSAVLEQFRPTHLMISVDPHPRTGPLEKPAFVAWLRQQSCFVEVYSDPTVSVFEVRDGWQRLVEQYPPSKEPLRMGF